MLEEASDYYFAGLGKGRYGRSQKLDARKRAKARTCPNLPRAARRCRARPAAPPFHAAACVIGRGAPSSAASGGSAAAEASPGHAGARGATSDSGGRWARKVDAREVAKQKAESALAKPENSLSEAESSTKALRGRLRVADEACAAASARATCVFLRFCFVLFCFVLFLHTKGRWKNE